MLSRRAALSLGVAAGGIGVAAVGAYAGGVLDDGLRAVGARPHREPDPRDVSVLRDAAAGQASLLAALNGLGGDATIHAVLTEQLRAVSDSPPEAAGSATDFSDFADQAAAAAAARADGALAAASLDVGKVLASMAAGLEQVAVAARRRA